jgi:hypothetical protein
MLHYTWLERLARDKHSSLMSPFVSYEDNEDPAVYLLYVYGFNRVKLS